MTTHEEARAEAFRRYDGDSIIDENTGERAPHDDYGYADTARQAFMAGVAWVDARGVSEPDVEYVRGGVCLLCGDGVLNSGEHTDPERHAERVEQIVGAEPDEDVREALADAIESVGVYIPGSHGHDYINPNHAADAILARFHVTPREGS